MEMTSMQGESGSGGTSQPSKRVNGGDPSMMKKLGVLLCALLLQAIIIILFTWMVVDNVVDDYTGKEERFMAVKVSNGALVDHSSGSSVAVRQHTVPKALNSQLPDELWKELQYFTVTGENNAFLHMRILSSGRYPKAGSKHGTVVRLFTFVGDIELNGSDMTFISEHVQDAFIGGGFSLAKSRRRLMGVFEILGFFNQLADVFEDVDVPDDEKPSAMTDFMTGNWAVENTIYESCNFQKCFSGDLNPATDDLSNGYPSTQAELDALAASRTKPSLAGIPGGEGVPILTNLTWYDSVEEFEGTMMFRRTETTFGVDKAQFHIMNQNNAFPDQIKHTVYDADTQSIYQSWDGNNMWCVRENYSPLKAKLAQIDAMNADAESSDDDQTMKVTKGPIVELDDGGQTATAQKWHIGTVSSTGVNEFDMDLYDDHNTGSPIRMVIRSEGRLLKIVLLNVDSQADLVKTYNFDYATGFKQDVSCVFEESDIVAAPCNLGDTTCPAVKSLDVTAADGVDNAKVQASAMLNIVFPAQYQFEPMMKQTPNAATWLKPIANTLAGQRRRNEEGEPWGVPTPKVATLREPPPMYVPKEKTADELQIAAAKYRAEASKKRLIKEIGMDRYQQKLKDEWSMENSKKFARAMDDYRQERRRIDWAGLSKQAIGMMVGGQDYEYTFGICTFKYIGALVKAEASCNYDNQYINISGSMNYEVGGIPGMDMSITAKQPDWLPGYVDSILPYPFKGKVNDFLKDNQLSMKITGSSRPFKGKNRGYPGFHDNSCYVGCFRDDWDRDFEYQAPGQDWTGEDGRNRCRTHCKDTNGGYTWMGIQAGNECFCANYYNTNHEKYGRVADSECPNNLGGAWRNSVYIVDTTTCKPGNPNFDEPALSFFTMAGSMEAQIGGFWFGTGAKGTFAARVNMVWMNKMTSPLRDNLGWNDAYKSHLMMDVHAYAKGEICAWHYCYNDEFKLNIYGTNQENAEDGAQYSSVVAMTEPYECWKAGTYECPAEATPDNFFGYDMSLNGFWQFYNDYGRI